MNPRDKRAAQEAVLAKLVAEAAERRKAAPRMPTQSARNYRRGKKEEEPLPDYVRAAIERRSKPEQSVPAKVDKPAERQISPGVVEEAVKPVVAKPIEPKKVSKKSTISKEDEELLAEKERARLAVLKELQELYQSGGD